MHKTLKGLFCTALIVSAAGCGGSSTSPGGNSTRTMTAVIDGVAYSGFVNSASLSVTGTLNIGSQNIDYTKAIAFTVSNATVGTFSVADRVTAATQTNNGLNTPLTGVWIAAGTLGSGTVTISSLTASGASGTFAFNAPANGQGATGTKVVTNGVFTATF